MFAQTAAPDLPLIKRVDALFANLKRLCSAGRKNALGKPKITPRRRDPGCSSMSSENDQGGKFWRKGFKAAKADCVGFFFKGRRKDLGFKIPASFIATV